jgi:hypothetical protein
MIQFIIDKPLAFIGIVILIWALINIFYLYFANKKTDGGASSLINRYMTYKLFKRYNSRQYEEMTRDLNTRKSYEEA